MSHRDRFPNRWYWDPVARRFFILPPPPNASDYSTRIFLGLKQYRELRSSQKVEWAERSNWSSRPRVLRMVQGSLLRDIRALSRLTKEREKQLVSKRLREWRGRTSGAILNYACYRFVLLPLVAYLRRFCPTPFYDVPASIVAVLVSVLPWWGYPVAIYFIATFEKQILDNTRLQEELKALEMKIEGGLEVPSTKFFEEATWDSRWE